LRVEASAGSGLHDFVQALDNWQGEHAIMDLRFVEIHAGNTICANQFINTNVKLQHAYTGCIMEKLQAFQTAALKGGFVDAQETEDGTVLWLRKPTAEAEDRMCIDRMKNSATVFWASIPWKINSKTFRQATELEAWIMLRLAVAPQS
jgi:hypothetical protein